ncbi:TlpA family protein disulfide reductase [Chitinophaga agri]|uniref:TlpA family protein disulfide reductase n=1 Tax=Chitinophaga agri TaxID=2703787 RepID=A0A6B9ZPY2_9BACT|nr:TlpA disulfide reductase family protein [Chitinophaga agri]QHS63534.1 TlpA family protein disulfide reductase [Chitinophaga agri]
MTKLIFWLIGFCVYTLPAVLLPGAALHGQQITFISSSGPKVVKLFYAPFLPANQLKSEPLTVTSRETMSLQLEHPVMATLYVDLLKPFTLYIRPEDSLTIEFDESGPVFTGPALYYETKAKQLGYMSASSRTFQLPETMSEKRIFTLVDSFQRVETAYLQQWKHRLPSDFYSREITLIAMQATTAKFIAANKKGLDFSALLKLDSTLRIPMKLPDSADLNYQADFYMYLSFYYFKKSADNDKESYTARLGKALKAMQTDGYTENTLENFLAFWYSFMIPTIGNHSALAEYTVFWQQIVPKVKDMANAVLVQGMLNEKANELNGAAVLKSGSEVPDIAFSDLDGGRVSLSDFKGKWIYLDFWATWCIPCRRDMALKKELGLDKLSDDLLLVNVCAESKHDEWLTAVKKFSPVGVNLYSDLSEKNKLISAYSIKGFPHYVIIGPDGKVAENTALPPSQIIDYLRKKIGR